VSKSSIEFIFSLAGSAGLQEDPATSVFVRGLQLPVATSNAANSVEVPLRV